MNKPTALPGQQVIYPDVLGALTNGARVNFDVIQVAVASQPAKINAGKPFDAIVLLQNTVKSEVDVAVRLVIPEKDISGKPGRFTTKLVKPILIGLRAGEVGYVHLPIQVGPQAAPGEGYTLELEIQIQKKSKELIRIRDVNGGTPFNLAQDLEDKQRQAFEGVRHLKFWAQTKGQPSNKVTLQLPFSVLSAAPVGLQPELKPGYKALWTEADYREKQAEPDHDEARLAALLPKLNRQSVFFPLLKFTQARFEAAGYRLWAGEAVMVTKLLCLVLEMGAPITVAGQGEPIYPHWYTRLGTVVRQNPELGSMENIPQLVTVILYPELIHDAALLAFSTLSTVTNEEFGTPEEINEYVEHLVNVLTHGRIPLEFSRAYIPLILGGLAINARVNMPRERPEETAQLFLRAIETRADEQDESTQFIVEIADDLIQRA